LQLLLQPVEGHVEREIGLLRDAVEVRAERLIELVEILLVLHERHAREVVELVQRRLDHAFLQRFEQRQVLLHGDRQLRGAQRVEKVDQHAVVSGAFRASAFYQRSISGCCGS
jgi:cell division ATPase FtsA